MGKGDYDETPVWGVIWLVAGRLARTRAQQVEVLEI